MIVTGTENTAVDFGQDYLAVREKEGRLYADEDVLYLPGISADHPHYDEWQLRKESCDRLRHYLKKKRRALTILEVGCGNGWLAHRMAGIHGCKVTGIDTGSTELEQARRVFNHIPDLQFIHGSIDATEIGDREFDLIVFAASLQYFPSVKEAINIALQKLKPNGEIHILDTPLYSPGEIERAQYNTRQYYTDLGFPGMAACYFHHRIAELASFPHQVLYRPSFFRHHIFQDKNPFPWVCIKNDGTR